MQTNSILHLAGQFKKKKYCAMGFPESNEGVGGLAFDEMDLLQSSTDLHAKTMLETSLRHGKTVKYEIPPGKLDGYGPYELGFPSMDTEWTDGTSGQLHGKFKVVKIVSGEEKDCDGNDDYSVASFIPF